jgi:hypothetical protein
MCHACQISNGMLFQRQVKIFVLSKMQMLNAFIGGKSNECVFSLVH